jgi:hypothetical protein
MAPSSDTASRVFISYAHKDGGKLALRLKKDLIPENGFTAWLDKERLEGGDLWSNKIERAIDDAEIVIALLSNGSYVSEICRAEQLRSLRMGKCVIPLKVQVDCDVPIFLKARQWLDFSSPESYEFERQKLIAAMKTPESAVLKDEYRTTYNCAPPLVENLVRRPKVLSALRDKLFAQGSHRNMALTSLRGMGGIGKTVLAEELCHDDVVQQAYPDGVFWFTIGQESKLDFVSRVRQVPALNRLLGDYQGEEACKSQYRAVLQRKAALIVLDDIWDTEDVKPFQAQSLRSRLVFTTRNASIAAAFGAGEFEAELLTEDESRQVLKRWSRWPSDTLPDEADKIIHKCGRLPLALSMIGASLRGAPGEYWKGVADRLASDLSLIEGKVGEYQHESFLRAIQVSLEALEKKSEQDKKRYLALAVLLEDMEAPDQILSALWGLDDFKTRRTAQLLVNLSLAQRDGPEKGLRLHDLQLDYLRKQYVEQEDLPLIREAIQLSYHVIVKDPGQFAPQLTGRLLPYQDKPAIARFLARIAAGTQSAWVRPLQPALNPPGTSLRRTLSGHTASVTSVVVTPKGLAVSASWDTTLKVWDLETGVTKRTLSGHSNWVLGVAVTSDGRHAVSASLDTTLRVWDLEADDKERTLSGHTKSVLGVALTADGRLVSASADGTLKVWELRSVANSAVLRGTPRRSMPLR